MQEQLRIEDPEVARVLIEGKSAQLLIPFMKRPLSLSDAAKELGVKLPKLSYHVKRFLTFGLLEIDSTERRGGRGVKLYRSSAQTFSIPFNVTPSETLEHLVIELTEPEGRRFRREIARAMQNLVFDWGFYLSRTEDDAVSFSLKPDRFNAEQSKIFTDGLLGMDEPAIVSSEGSLRLDFVTAKSLQRELVELYERYTDLQQKDAQAYAFRVGLTPMQDKSLE